MSPLPESPAGALHVLPPASLLALLALAATFLLLLAVMIARRLLRRRQRPVTEPPTVPRATAPPPSPAISIGTRIQALERKFLKTKAFRDGCHSLAVLIKGHLAQVTGLAAERMTSTEIERAIDKLPAADPRVGGFMTSLSRRRYGRNAPRRRHFIAACEEARELLG